MLGLGVGLLLLVVPVGATVLSSYVWGGDPEPQNGVPVAVASRPPVTEGTGVPDPTPSGTVDAVPDGVSSPTPRATGAPATPSGPTPTPTAGRTSPSRGGGSAPQGPSTPPPPVAEAPPPAPVSLGPEGRSELTQMIDRYCDRHVGATSWADPRGDGQWDCRLLLLGSRRVDLDTACRDTYGDGAFADNPNPEEAFGWRCFRR